MAPPWARAQAVLTPTAVHSQAPVEMASQPGLGGESMLDGGLWGGALQAGALRRRVWRGFPRGARLWEAGVEG